MRHTIEEKLPEGLIRSKYHDKFMWELADLLLCLNNSEEEICMDNYINQSKETFEVILQKAETKEHITSKEKQAIIEMLKSIKSMYKDSTDYATYHSKTSGCAYEPSEDTKVKGAYNILCPHKLNSMNNTSSLIGK